MANTELLSIGVNDNDNEVYSWSQVETKKTGGQHGIMQYLHYL